MKHTQGGFTYQDLKKMDIGEYNALIYAINKLAEEEEEEAKKTEKEMERKYRGIRR